jgi:hypothetical protein
LGVLGRPVLNHFLIMLNRSTTKKHHPAKDYSRSAQRDASALTITDTHASDALIFILILILLVIFIFIFIFIVIFIFIFIIIVIVIRQFRAAISAASISTSTGSARQLHFTVLAFPRAEWLRADANCQAHFAHFAHTYTHGCGNPWLLHFCNIAHDRDAAFFARSGDVPPPQACTSRAGHQGFGRRLPAPHFRRLSRARKTPRSLLRYAPVQHLDHPVPADDSGGRKQHMFARAQG